MRKWFLPALLIISSHAAEPAWKSELTPPTPGSFPALTPSKVDFRLSWEGMIDSGKLQIDFSPAKSRKPGTYIVRSSASSTGAAAALFPYSSSFWSELDPASFRPRYFHAVEIDQKENVTTTVKHFADRVETSEVSKRLKTGVSKTTDKTFKFAPVFDIFSAMLHIRSQKLAIGDNITLVVCPFDSPYLLRVKVLGREQHAGRAAIKMSLGMNKINRETLELMPYKKLKRDATLWLGDDADRLPLEFRAAAFIGDVRATLTGLQKQ